MLRFPALLTLVLLFLSCEPSELPLPADYEATVLEWRSERVQELTQPRGWLSLVGLHWLEEGTNTVGSAADNAVRLPASVPAYVGTFVLGDTAVSSRFLPDGSLRINADSTEFGYGPIEWSLIERGGRWGVRVRDTLQPARTTLAPFDHYPIDPAYRVRARFLPARVRSSRNMRNALGMEYAVPVVGTLRFRLRGKQENLLALDGGADELFLIFSDATTGETTYGGGRYLYCPRPDEDGQTIIDFNKAYNPPCVFTEYATCLLPLQDNHLKLALEAGEKTYGDH